MDYLKNVVSVHGSIVLSSITALILTLLVLTASTVRAEVLLTSDFSQDPGFSTTDSSDYYWNQTNETYHFRSVDSEDDFAYIPIQYDGGDFTISVDFKIEAVTWSGDWNYIYIATAC